MTYLDYINHFWRKDREYFFAPEVVAIYFRLLHHANELGWKAHFHLSLERLMLEAGIKSRKPFDTARKTLRDAGLLEFENGNGRGCSTKYTLLAPETSPKRAVKNTPLSGTLSGEVSGKNRESFGKEKGAVHKTKIKTKTKGANAPAASEQGVDLKAVVLPPAAQPEPWLVWLLANAPRVQQMKSPLTAKQWASLQADFGEPLLREVLGHMENHADLLKKYTSANLTARDWCKRRSPAEGKPPAVRPPSAAPVATSPALNHAFLAEQAAREQAALDAQNAEWQQSHACAA